MNEDPWRGEFEDSDDQSQDDAFAQRDWQHPAAGFIEQIVSGSWPIRVPFRTEIAVEGQRVQVRPARPGEEPSGENSQVFEIVVEFARWKVREMIVEQMRAPRIPAESLLPDLTLLARVDRACFLQTAAAHFVELLADGGTRLLGDPCLPAFLGEIHEFDHELIGEFVAATNRAEPFAGGRLRDVILETLNDPQVREHLGWLTAAAIVERM